MRVMFTLRICMYLNILLYYYLSYCFYTEVYEQMFIFSCFIESMSLSRKKHTIFLCEKMITWVNLPLTTSRGILIISRCSCSWILKNNNSYILQVYIYQEINIYDNKLSYCLYYFGTVIIGSFFQRLEF